MQPYTERRINEKKRNYRFYGFSFHVCNDQFVSHVDGYYCYACDTHAQPQVVCPIRICSLNRRIRKWLVLNGGIDDHKLKAITSKFPEQCCSLNCISDPGKIVFEV